MTYQPGQGWLLENQNGRMEVSGTWADGFKPEMLRITFEMIDQGSPGWPLCSTYDSRFGYAVAINGDTAIVGDPRAVNGGVIQRGGAYIFQRTGETWAMQANLVSTEATDRSRFGSAVAISGDYAVVGSPDASSLYCAKNHLRSKPQTM